MQIVCLYATLVMCTMLSTCGFNISTSARIEQMVMNDESNVYGAAIDYMVSIGDMNGNSTIVMLQNTSSKMYERIAAKANETERYKWFKIELIGLEEETFFDFESVMKAKQKPIEIQTDRPIIYQTEEEIKQIFSDPSGWDIFYTTFPKSDGFYYFSRIGFNKNKTQALVKINNSCNYHCGKGVFLLANKINNKFIITSSRIISLK